MLTREDIRFNEYIIRFLPMLHLLPARLEPTTGRLYLKSNRILGKSLFLTYQILISSFTIFCTYRSVDFILFSKTTWDPVQVPCTLIVNVLAGVIVAVMYILANLDKMVKIYNGLFNLNENKGAAGSIIVILLYLSNSISILT